MGRSRLPSSQRHSSARRPSASSTILVPISARQIIIPSQGVDKGHRSMLESQIVRLFSPNKLENLGASYYLTYDTADSVAKRPANLSELGDWSGKLTSIFQNSLIPSELNSVLTPKGCTVVFAKHKYSDNKGESKSATMVDLSGTSIEYQPIVPDEETENPVDTIGRVRIREDWGNKTSAWLDVMDSHLVPIEGTNISLWSMDVKGRGQPAGEDDVSNDN